MSKDTANKNKIPDIREKFEILLSNFLKDYLDYSRELQLDSIEGFKQTREKLQSADAKNIFDACIKFMEKNLMCSDEEVEEIIDTVVNLLNKYAKLSRQRQDKLLAFFDSVIASPDYDKSADFLADVRVHMLTLRKSEVSE